MSGSQVGFPNYYTNLKDNSSVTVPDTTVIPLHMPLIFTFAEKGPINTPVLGGGDTQQNTFGSGMVTERSPYFTHQSVFLKRALPFQQVMVVRVCDPAATAASLVLCVTLTPTSLIQYQRTATGALILTNGQPTPQLQSNGTTPVTQPGYTLTYSIRELASTETLSTVQTTTSTVAGGTATTYPLMAFEAGIGASGNLAGFRLFYNQNFNTTAVANTNSMLYSFQPVSLNSTTNIQTPIYDIYNNQTQTFSFKPSAFDATTSMYYDLNDVIANNFNGIAGPPYTTYVYGENVQTIGEAILAVSPELGSISPYMINIISAVDQNNNPYEHLVVDGTGTSLLNSNVVNYLAGGSDGSLTNTTFESLVVNFLSGAANPAISDSFRYPVTHIYDSGFSLANKEAMMAIYSLRDDVKITFSTQDASLAANTAAMDQSTGSALRAMLLLTPESIDFGTQFCRADIYQQCGLLSDTNIWNNIVPASLDRMIKRCRFNGSTTVIAEPKGRPNSEVSIFKVNSINWTPATDAQKSLSWNTGLNYIQFCDTNTLFYPDLISVYPLENSLLSNDCFVDYVAVYTKAIVRNAWTIYVGTDTPATQLYKSISDSIDGAIRYAFNGIIQTNTVVSQTAVDTALGYQLTVTVNVSGSMPNRVWQIIVPINRQSTTSSSS